MSQQKIVECLAIFDKARPDNLEKRIVGPLWSISAVGRPTMLGRGCATRRA
jgi:hypothetical protein